MNTEPKINPPNQSLIQSPPSATMNKTQLKILLHQYETLVSLYKHHLDLVLKVNIFLYAVTGAILSFYLSAPNKGLMLYALIFPSIMNLAYAIFFFQASNKIEPFRIDLIEINKALKLISYPDVTFLKKALQISAWLFLFISIGLTCITISRIII